MTATRDELIAEIKSLEPWHHNLQLTDDLSTGEIYSPEGTLLAKDNQGVSLIKPRDRFMWRANKLFPNGLSGKRFLDCACNAGGYCFFSRELEADLSVGFDVREHWINQAKFVQKNRQVGPTDRIEFHVMDLYDLGKQNFKPFDFVYFSGIFYHLPDPVTGLKLAADLTSDVIVVNTAAMPGNLETDGLTMAYESTDKVMSGVYQLAWFPNNVSTLTSILKWMGFKDFALTKDVLNPQGRRRIEVLAAREKGRFDNFDEQLK